MSATSFVRAPSGSAPCVAGRVRVRRGARVRCGQPLLEWSATPPPPPPPLRSPRAGRVVRVLVQEGDVVQPDQPLVEIEECSHTTVMKDMCADCGEDLRSDDAPQNNIAVVPMIHSVPELKVSEELARKIGKEDSERLLRDRKLVLLVDLDQTLIHTTNDNVPSNLKDVYHFRLKSWGPGGYGAGRWYHTRFRPGTSEFLKTVANSYELHICTFGARAYAHQVAELLDPCGQLFSNRILSRDECFDIHTKTPNLRALFPCGDNLVCIIDDREDVWNRAANLIQVKPYHFFEHTGDINAPPGLEKTERDVEGQGIHVQDLQAKDEPTNSKTEASTEMPSLDFDDKKSTESVPELSSTSKKHVEGIAESSDISEKPVESVVESSDVSKKPVENIVESDTSEKPAENIMELSDTSEKPVVKVISEKKEIADKNKIIPMDEDKSDSTMDYSIELDPERAIVKDIERIVSKVQDNFISSDTTSKCTSEQNTKDKSETQCDSSKDKSEEFIHDGKLKWKLMENGMIDIEDSDDYLLYLEEILERIHKFFFEMYDKMEAGSVPDLKEVIPQVKSRVLSGTSLVFSGLVPTHQKLEHSRAFMVAQSLGAEVTQDFTDRTTHLVAVRTGTAKVHACRKLATTNNGKGPHIVTPAWLWCCAERWQHVDEKMFPLRGNTRLPRRPPPHCGSPPRIPITNTTPPRRRTPSGRFMDTINPLLSFSSDDIANMDKEVEDIINESDESDSDDKTSNNGKAGDVEFSESQEDILRNDFGNISSESDSVESLSGDYPHSWKPDSIRKRRRSASTDVMDAKSDSTPPKQVCDSGLKLHDIEDSTQDSSQDTSEKFRRGELVSSDLPDQNDSDSNNSTDPPDDTDDGEWNMMGAALEREFLGLDK